jgi:hypothetical protein
MIVALFLATYSLIKDKISLLKVASNILSTKRITRIALNLLGNNPIIKMHIPLINIHLFRPQGLSILLNCLDLIILKE